MASVGDSERIAFFGDSLTDGGLVFEITSQLLTIPFPLQNAGYAGTLSNGPVYSQILPELLDIPMVECRLPTPDDAASPCPRAAGTR